MMAKRTMSPEAKKKIAAAARKRWAAYRAANANGPAPAKAGRRARRTKRAPSSLGNRYLDMTVAQLVEAKQQIDKAWKTALKLLRK